MALGFLCQNFVYFLLLAVSSRMIRDNIEVLGESVTDTNISKSLKIF